MRAAFSLALLAACSSAAPAPASTAPSPAPTPEPVERAEATPAPEPEAPPPPPVRARYDLARHAERAERFVGRTAVLDLGGLDGARATRGGWRSGFSRERFEDVDALVSEGRQGRLLFGRTQAPSEDVRARFVGRVAVPGAIAVYLDGEELTPLELPSDAWGVGEVLLPKSKLGPGEHELLLRAAGSRSVPGVSGRVGLALRELQLVEGGTVAETLAPLALEEDGVRALRLGANERAGFVTEVAAQDRLRALVRGEGALVVHAVTDGEPRELVRVDATAEGAPLDVELASLDGQVVRLELAAEGGTLRLLAPAIVEPLPEGAAEPRPIRNVLLVLVDTLRADKLGPYREETRVQTPGLLRFAERATTMLHAHSQENWTKPSVATLLSSLMPWEHATTQHESVVPRTVRLLPEILKEDGFHTGAFICNGYVSDRFGFGRGWSTYRNYIREGRRTMAEFVAADVLQWLDARPSDKPFFLYVHTIDPHVPYRPPAEHLALYGDPSYRGRVDFSRDATLLENVKLGRLRLDDRDKAHLQALYDGEITYTDVHFSAILEGLERRGLADDTMVVLTSDHGEEFWDHGSVGHGHSVYEELLHVPLFVRLPGQPTRRLRDAVGLVDVMPTILDALGRPIPENLSGRSFLPSLRGEGHDAPQATVSGFMEHWRTVNVGRYKLIQRPGHASVLHDLVEDPGETTNVAERHPLVVAWLRGLLGASLDATRSARAPSARTPRTTHAAETTAIDPETAAQLRALGYVGD
ncbi:MAG: sulfatase [Sandaracinus sp.]|nr:sulfatase [Sandaracinus sp.]MCB9612931.1 sulfatase [Sandaracinus sp.]MCB9632658.1 sulfatase [Sandaracinus sp.]